MLCRIDENSLKHKSFSNFRNPCNWKLNHFGGRSRDHMPKNRLNKSKFDNLFRHEPNLLYIGNSQITLRILFYLILDENSAEKFGNDVFSIISCEF